MELAEEISQFYADPFGFVRFAFPWREPGPLAEYDGPDVWQREVLEEIGADIRARGFDGVRAVEALREAVASGHGIGKSALVAWLVCWIMSTRPGAIGTVTANTFIQLESKTWAQIKRWAKLCITSHWFVISVSRMARIGAEDSWFCKPQTCKEENSEAFAGQHAASSTSFYIFDEASAIPDSIWQVAEGGLTDGEPMFFAFGNPTRSSGKFYR
ncbi:MAG: terminase, partial [Bryobacteraceae bacterium]